MQNSNPLILTKLHLPFIRPSLVPRSRLHARIAEGLDYPLTLVVAPAGFGKTTLVVASITDGYLPVAWLSLDREDNQLSRFLTYLVAAFQGVEPNLGGEAVQLMAGMQPTPPEVVLTSLINDLDTRATACMLVLDDYQFISTQAVHQSVTFLLEHIPQAVHLLIASRSDPPLPLARLRARGQMVEIREADLRFTPHEASQFLHDVMGLDLDNRITNVLQERTEGWVAGLQMAALSLRDRKDVDRFIEGFSGTHRYILDYLLEETLEGQSPEIQRFLLYTSILDRLSAPLCDALFEKGEIVDEHGGQRSAPSINSRSTLEYLECENLFLVPLDDERTWYRYHHLFADLLAAQLLRSHPEKIPELHARASIWFEHNGWLDQAIEHAFSAGDVDRAGRLVDLGAQKLTNQFSFERIQHWIDQLPEELLLQRPWIGVTQGWLWVAKMKTGSLDTLLDNIEKRLPFEGKDRDPNGEQQDIKAHITSLRAYAAFFKGDWLRCATLSNQALNLLSPANMVLRVRILVQLGETCLVLQELGQAKGNLYQAIEDGIAVEDFQSVATACMRLYQTLKMMGRLNEAENMLRRVLEALSHAGRATSPIMTKSEQCWGDLLQERGQMDEAGIHLAKALEYARQYQSPLDIVTSLMYQSMWFIHQAKWDAAQKALDEAETWLRSSTIPPIIWRTWSLQQARLYQYQGDGGRADQILCNLPGEEAGILISRGFLKKGELESAQRLLSQLEQDARAGKRLGSLIQILLLQACVFHAFDQPSKAIQALVECLTFTQPEAYLMTYLEEGEPIFELLKSLKRHALSQPIGEYVRRLLRAFEQQKDQSLFLSNSELSLNPAQCKGQMEDSLLEPLSQRELEVLQWIALGKTNQEIAHQLVISVGTVKAHSASIYRKLDTANRTEAVARARRLGLLSS